MFSEVDVLSFPGMLVDQHFCQQNTIKLYNDHLNDDASNETQFAYDANFDGEQRPRQ